MTRLILSILLLLPLSATAEVKITTALDQGTPATASRGHIGAANWRRVPAEWEPQEAIWLQWPVLGKRQRRRFAASAELFSMKGCMCFISHLRCLVTQRLRLFKQVAADHELITWHGIPTTVHGCDNGPVFVIEAGKPVYKTGSSMLGWKVEMTSHMS